jgi:adenylate kinase
MIIIIMGPQGSGKTTQAKLLAQFLNIPHISTGTILKNIVSDQNHPLYNLVSKEYTKGSLVSDSVVNQILEDAIDSSINKGGFILDGTPRRHSQVELIDTVLNKHNKKIDYVFFVNTSIQESKKRILKRAQNEHRPDDTPEAVAHRLQIYKDDTLPVINEYKNRGILHQINGDRPIEPIQNDIRKALSST